MPFDGKYMRIIREEKGWSRKTLSSKSGVPEMSIRNYENSYRNPKAEQLEKIADVLGVSVGVLLHGVDKEMMKEHFRSLLRQSQEDQILTPFWSMNERGRRKATENVSDLAKIPEYAQPIADNTDETEE